MKQSWEGPLNKIDEYRWEIPKTYNSGMRVPGLIYASSNLLEKIRQDQALEQVANVAFLPGIVGHSIAMPDIHWGYGFCIGGVAATTIDNGVISPGGVGFDLNCGIRLIRTNLTQKEVKPKIELLVNELFRAIPSGVGSKGKIKISYNEIKNVLRRGSRWAVERGFGWEEDILFTEEEGCMKDANPDLISKRALERGKPQLGTLGSGNHFLEIQVIDKVYDPEVARELGLGIRTSGMYRLLGNHAESGKQIRDSTSRPAISLCPSVFTGREKLLCRYGLRGKLRLGKSPVHNALDS
jgi:tRNA-splicing ligase RtcB